MAFCAPSLVFQSGLGMKARKTQDIVTPGRGQALPGPWRIAVGAATGAVAVLFRQTQLASGASASGVWGVGELLLQAR